MSNTQKAHQPRLSKEIVRGIATFGMVTIIACAITYSVAMIQGENLEPLSTPLQWLRWIVFPLALPYLVGAITITVASREQKRAVVAGAAVVIMVIYAASLTWYIYSERQLEKINQQLAEDIADKRREVRH